MKHPVEALFGEEDAPEGGALPEAASGAATGRVVAKAMKEGVIADIYAALADAIAAGETLQTFSAKVEEIAATKGWMAKESAAKRAWRTRLIYETNIRMHYQAERMKQITAPDVKNFYPFWRYVHGWLREPLVPRPEHVAWDGLILSADDPWWREHFPPNGWGCTCGIEILSRGDLEKLGRADPDDAPDMGAREWIDPETGEVRQIPIGVDPGFDVTPMEWLARQPLRAKAARQKAFEEAAKAQGAAKSTIEVRP